MYILQGLLLLKKPKIREIARSFSHKYSSPQSLVNRIRRFLHNHKWNFIDVQISLARLIINRMKSSYLFVFFLSDFTYITEKWRILSFAVPIGGRALPILLIPVRSDSFSKMRWESEVNLIIHAISLLLPILPKRAVFLFDREFTYPELMKFLMENYGN